MAFNDVEALCKLTPEGLNALSTRDKFNVTPSFEQSTLPASYDAATGKCTLDNTMGTAKLASYFVHEMTHARQQKLGKSADVTTASRDDFVKISVDEEFLATAFQMQFFVRLDTAGHLNGIKPLTDKNAPPRYDQYKSAYDAGVRKVSGGGADANKIVELGLGNANQMLRIFIYEGGLGVGGATYADYYRGKWRDAHRT